LVAGDYFLIYPSVSDNKIQILDNFFQERIVNFCYSLIADDIITMTNGNVSKI